MNKADLARLYITVCLSAVILGTFARTFVFQPFQVPSASMEPALLIGDHLLVNKSLFRTNPEGWWSKLLPNRPVRRGDVVVVKHPSTRGRFLLKRCVGLPGETVETRDHQLFINGQRIDESGYAQHPTSSRSASFGPLTLRQGELFLLGDHRDRSHDSRSFGPVLESALVGRAVLIYWSTRFVGEPDRPTSWGKIGELIVARFTQTRWQRTGTLVR